MDDPDPGVGTEQCPLAVTVHMAHPVTQCLLLFLLIPEAESVAEVKIRGRSSAQGLRSDLQAFLPHDAPATPPGRKRPAGRAVLQLSLVPRAGREAQTRHPCPSRSRSAPPRMSWGCHRHGEVPHFENGGGADAETRVPQRAPSSPSPLSAALPDIYRMLIPGLGLRLLRGPSRLAWERAAAPRRRG